MHLTGGETIKINIGGIEKKWRLSKIDSKLVKYFDENNNYTQMPYEDFKKLIKEAGAIIESKISFI